MTEHPITNTVTATRIEGPIMSARLAQAVFDQLKNILASYSPISTERIFEFHVIFDDGGIPVDFLGLPHSDILVRTHRIHRQYYLVRIEGASRNGDFLERRHFAFNDKFAMLTIGKEHLIGGALPGFPYLTGELKSL